MSLSFGTVLRLLALDLHLISCAHVRPALLSTRGPEAIFYQSKTGVAERFLVLGGTEAGLPFVDFLHQSLCGLCRRPQDQETVVIVSCPFCRHVVEGFDCHSHVTVSVLDDQAGDLLQQALSMSLESPRRRLGN